MHDKKKLMIANWKMNGDLVRLRGLAQAAGSLKTAGADIILCPAFPYLELVRAVLAPGVSLGAQDVALVDETAGGAQTGDVSPAMLKEMGVRYVIIGHSERRLRYGESDSGVRAKAVGALAAGVTPIICVGETAADRAAGRAHDVVRDQILNGVPRDVSGAESIVLAYEPVWAVGTGQMASESDIMAMHEFMAETVRESLALPGGLRMVYGGSVKGANAAAILDLPHVGGVLVGGASLKVEELTRIIESACGSSN